MELAVHTAGTPDGPEALLLHPAGLTGAELLGMFSAPDHHLLAPDRTGYGESRRSWRTGGGRSQGGVPEVALLADDVEALATLLHHPAHVFGYSYGAVLALALAARHPDRVRSLSLLEPPAFQAAQEDPDATATMRRIEHGLAGAAGVAAPEYWRAFTSATFADRMPFPADTLPEDRMVASQREEVPWTVPLDLSTIREAHVPTLVICGDWDPGFAAAARRVAEQLGGAVVQLAGADHFFLPQWEQVVTTVREHWRSASA